MNKRKNITRDYVIKSKEHEIICTLSHRDCKRLRIAITPDLKVKITVPLRASDSFIHEAVREKTPWILKSIHRLKNCKILPFPEKYVSGERLAYLGNEYILRVDTGKRKAAGLSHNMLIVQRPDPDMKSVKREIDKWFRLQAELVFGDLLKAGYSIVSQYGVTEPFLKIRRMKSRWGSCSRSGKITLNLKLIHLPLSCIEYIIMHELCHLKHLNHSMNYYSFLQRCMPDWKDRKAILESYRLVD